MSLQKFLLISFWGGHTPRESPIWKEDLLRKPVLGHYQIHPGRICYLLCSPDITDQLKNWTQGFLAHCPYFILTLTNPAHIDMHFSSNSVHLPILILPIEIFYSVSLHLFTLSIKKRVCYFAQCLLNCSRLSWIWYRRPDKFCSCVMEAVTPAPTKPGLGRTQVSHYSKSTFLGCLKKLVNGQ